MARTLKYMRRALGLLAGFFVALAAVLYFVDFNEYRGVLAARLGDAMGRPLRIDGDLKLRLGLRIAFSASDISMTGKGGPDGRPIARIGRISFGLALWPLLQQKIDIDHLRIDDADIVLQRDPTAASTGPLKLMMACSAIDGRCPALRIFT